MNGHAHGPRAVRWILGLLLVLPLPAAAPGQSTPQGDVARGARVYGDMCGRCHNPRSPLERSDRDWVTIVNHMRIRGNLTGGQVRDVLAFLQGTNADPQRPAPLRPPAEGPGTEEVAPGGTDISSDPEVIARGERLIEQNACLGCHIVGQAGGRVGPSLNGVVRRKGADFVRRKIADPTFDNATSMMPNLGLSMVEIEAIVAFLNTLDGR